MALEDLTGTKYIDDLNSSNPAAGDNVSEGDDHIRGIKNVLKTTFPSIDGAITATDTELNYVDGVTSAIQTQIDAKAPLASPTLTGNPVAPTQSANDNSTKLATTAYTDAAIAALSDSAPSTLNTLNELAAALGDDANYATTTTNAIAAKMPLAGGTFTGNVYHGDNIKAQFGTGNDLKIYHDASASFIEDSGTGNLKILADNLHLKNAADDEYKAYFDTNGGAALYHDNVLRIETTSGGVTVSGNIANTSGVFTIDSANDIHLDADGGDVVLLDGGTQFASLSNSSSNFHIVSEVSDKDMLFRGNDGGSFITALTLDMSASGEATFNGGIKMGDNKKIKLGGGEDLEIYHDGSNSIIHDNGTGNLLLKGDNVSLRSSGNESFVTGVTNGAVSIYYDNSAKLETETGGVQVTGSVWASAGRFGLDSNDHIDIETTTIQFKLNGNEEMRLEADGDLHVDGDVIAYSSTISDERLKDNIEVVDGALDKVKQLKGVTFNRKQDGQKSAGVIAQDVEKVLPEAVKHKALPLQTGDDELFKTVQYDALHALLIESIKELSARVEELEAK